ncbi:MAG TPA: AEC family transporter [Clostridia bacterium]|nr:AEC family transporter [Clostridia bacterium]
MAQLLNSLSAVALILMLACVGYICGKAGWLKHEHKAFLVKLIVNVCVPLMCLDNFFNSITLDMLKGAETLFLVVVLSLSVSMALSLVLARLMRISQPHRGGFVVMCALSNSLFVGLPMCTELFGTEATPFVMIFYIINTSFFWTVGALMLKQSGTQGHVRLTVKETLKGVLNPPFVSLVVCVLLLAAGFRPPHLILSFSKYMGALVTPLSLLYVGFVIYETGLKTLKLDRQMTAVLAMRFVISPLLTLALCHLLAVTGIQRGVITLEAAMPVMVQSVVVSSSVGADESYVATGLSLTTLACFVAIPLLMLLV